MMGLHLMEYPKSICAKYTCVIQGQGHKSLSRVAWLISPVCFHIPFIPIQKSNNGSTSLSQITFSTKPRP